MASTRYEMLYEEYKENELLNQNFTFDEVLDLYEQWKQTTSLSFNNFIQWILDKDEKTNSDSKWA
jgi:hypothetical protein